MMFADKYVSLTYPKTQQITARTVLMPRLTNLFCFQQDTDCDEDLKKQAIGFYKYLWIRRKGEDVSDVYKGLPSNFVSEISFASHKNLFKKVWSSSHQKNEMHRK